MPELEEATFRGNPPARFARGLVSVAASIAALLKACGSDDSPEPATATILVSYRAPTAPRTDLSPACVADVGETHMHPSWLMYRKVPLTPVGDDRWERSFSDVPIGVNTFELNDPNRCDLEYLGRTFENVYINDVLLTRRVETPVGPGLRFLVDGDGNVTP
jgi:hypothetical protein